MNTQKIVLKTVYCLAGLLFLASIGYNVFQHQQFKIFSNKPVSDKITKNEPVSNSNTVSSSISAGKEGNPNISRISEMEYHLKSANEELDMINEQLDEERSKKNEFKIAYSGSSIDRSDPYIKKMNRKSWAYRTNRDYGPLFNKLNISKEEFDEFKEMLINELEEKNEMSVLYSRAYSEEEKNKVSEQSKEIDKKYKDKMRDFFGEEKNEVYQTYKISLIGGRGLHEFMETQSPENRINEEQTETLVDSMHEGRKAVFSEMGLDINNPPTKLTRKTLPKMMERAEQIYEKYVEASRSNMTPEQVDKYEAFLKQKLEAREDQLEMIIYLNENE